jgi:hypothetical protein
VFRIRRYAQSLTLDLVVSSSVRGHLVWFTCSSLLQVVGHRGAVEEPVISLVLRFVGGRRPPDPLRDQSSGDVER